ncbi:hypothetical protein SAMN02745164_02208 [Marinitoga hydrogenitolerans DSM 16785]|uniref:DUF5723 domain-containing protein n=1 Tax=Marinitoga hydrogenitolerans (strain DSM 16785 / JCM 12826 / AT1271) TaxID=1122195 RepID=A0A1M5AJQ5_MARH1|nr:hypothetical protein [Marinitoga hydrogenitolerans]SHF30508.1 hypothetical protein SAMN02745164_02208 [Marinitoga hydrogenitolerans DSM 16785]
MKKILIALVLSLVVLSFAQIDALSPWNKDLNPALVSWSVRGFIDLGIELKTGLVQESLKSLDKAIDLNLFGNEGNYYDLSSSEVLGRNVSFDMFAKLKLGSFVLAPEFTIQNIDKHNFETLDFRNALLARGGLHIGLKGEDFSFGGTIKSYIPVFDVVRRNNGEEYFLITAFPNEINNLPYDYSLLYDGPNKIFNEMDMLMDKLLNNGIITLDVGFVAGKDYPAIGFGVKDIPIAQGIGIYKYDTFAEVHYSTETLEFNDFVIANYSNDQMVSRFAPWKMTFFITLPILLDFVPSIEYAPETEDFVWGIAAGKRLFWGFLPFWAEIKNYNINTDYDVLNYWTFNGGIGVNVYLGEIHASLSTEALEPENLFNARNTAINVNMAIGF